jgi:ABC-type transporter Mla subunit MlaD
MSGGDGIDIGAVYQLLTHVAEMVDGHGQKLDDHTRKLDDHTRKLDDHTRKLDDLSAGLSSLRRAVTEYHASVLGHGILISELDERVRRIEQHLNLTPAA